MIDYTELKSAMADAGFPVSNGDGWTAEDGAQYRSYVYLNWPNLTPIAAAMGLAYPTLLPPDFPGAEDDPVPEPELVSLALTPATATVLVGATQQFTATGTYDDESTQDLTDTADWASDDTDVATVAAGLATGVFEGEANVTASVGAISGNAVLTVETEG